jgi:hypothetical protein
MATSMEIEDAILNLGFVLLPHTVADTTDIFVKTVPGGLVHCEWTRSCGKEFFVVYKQFNGIESHITYRIGSKFSALTDENGNSTRHKFDNADALYQHLLQSLGSGQ